jgi:hypothetical protein
MAVAMTGLAACWESISSRVPASAIAVSGGTVYVVETDYVERVNTRNFPETQSPQLSSTSHRVLTRDLDAAASTAFAAYPGALDARTSGEGDPRPYLLADAQGVALWDRRVLQDHLFRNVSAACPGGHWFDQPLLSGPLFMACAGDTALYRFDDASGASCRIDTAALVPLPRFAAGESPIDRIFAHRGDAGVVVQAAGRFFRSEGCAGGELREFDPFAGLPVGYRPVAGPPGQVSPPPYTELVDARGDRLLFTSGVSLERADVLLLLSPGTEALRIPLPEAVRASPAFVAGPWLVGGDCEGCSEHVLWQVTLADNRAELVTLRLQDLRFERHVVAAR